MLEIVDSRRRFIHRILRATAGAATGTVLYTVFVEPHWLEITHRDLPIAMLPPSLEGSTVALLTDLHVGPQVSDAYLIESFRRVKALQPDFVLYGGDFITYRRKLRFPPQLGRVLQHAPHGTLGTFGILGNHDYGLNWRAYDIAAEVTRIAHESGITMLRNEVATVAGLQFAGLEDLWSYRFNAPLMFRQFDPHLPSIVLAHNPDSADEPVWSNYHGWMLSGHTHGGQCKPPFLPPPLLPVKNRRYVSGEFDLSGARRLYISRGVGHLLQVRFNVRPEVTMFRLRSV